MNPSPAKAPWRLGPTTSDRSRALLRYTLSAVAVGLGAAFLQRRFEGGLVAGFVLGVALGLFLFRHELSRAFAPTLALGQQSAFLVIGHRSEPARWDRIDQVLVKGDRLIVDYADATGAARRWELPERVLALPAPALAAILTVRVRDPAGRQNLPTDDEVRQRLKLA